MDNTIFVQLVTGAIGGAIVSSVVGPYLSQSKDRKSARATVLSAIRKVETVRWADENTTHSSFRDEIANLHASALVAGADRNLTECYARLATVARTVSEEELETTGGYEGSGGIPSGLSDLVRDAAEVLIDSLWRPARTLPLRKKMLAQILEKEKKLRAQYKREKQPINWNPKS